MTTATHEPAPETVKAPPSKAPSGPGPAPRVAATQQANCYAFQVKRLSMMSQSGYVGQSTGYYPGAYLGEQVYVFAASLAQANYVLAQVYGSDLGPVTGGATLVQGAWTTMTGS